MAPQMTPQDEWYFDNPHLITTLQGGTLHSDSIFWYFMNSPFYDASSNNHDIFKRFAGQPGGPAILSSRHAMEERLRTEYQSGMQFVVVGEPQAEGEPWIIQRQEKIVDQETGRTARIEVTGTYYTQGTRILMAKSVLDVLQLRLLSVSTQLQELFELSKDLSHFSPATGHTYLPPSFELNKASGASRIGSRAGSRAGSPTLSDAPPSQVSARAGTGTGTGADTGAGTSDTTTAFSDAHFMRSLNLTEIFYDEYADENPLQGEPGSFVLQNSRTVVLARREAEEKRRKQQEDAAIAAATAAATATTTQPPAPSASAALKQESQLPSGLHSSTSTPKPGTPAALDSSRKASVASAPKPGKEKRRKSKGPGSLASPVTPTAPQV